MNILVCIKQVPDTTEIRMDPKTNTLIRAGVPSTVNPFDKYALEAAVQLRETLGGTVTAMTMGPAQAAQALRECYALGADRMVLVSDRRFGGADTYATSYTLAQAVRALGGFDLILCGRQAIDGDTAQVGPMLAEHLGLPQLTCACAITIEDGAIRIRQEGERAYRVLRAPLPAVVTVVKTINEPRLPNVMRKLQANRMQPQTLTADDLPALDPDCIGLHGSPTKVSRTFVPVRTKQTVRIDGAQPEAARIRLVERVVPLGELEQTTLAYAEKLAAKPPIAVQMCKKCINIATDAGTSVGLLAEEIQGIYTVSTKDKAEAAAAMLEKRPGRYTCE